MARSDDAMLRFTFSLIILLILSCLLQQFLPAITVWHNARILLLALVFVCAAVSLPTPAMLVLAFIAGFLWDAQQTILQNPGDPMVYEQPADAIRFGSSIILFAMMGFFMQGIQPVFRQGKWHISALSTGVAILLYQLVEIFILSFIRGHFLLTNSILIQISATSLLTMLLSPLVFWLIFRTADFFNYKIRFDGRKKRRQSRSF